MNKQSNLYTIIYSVVMVVVVATVLAAAATILKPQQQKNVEIEKKSDILGSVGLYDAAKAPANKDKFIEDMYSKYIIEGFLVNNKGEKVGTPEQAFKVLTSLKAAYAQPSSEQKLPVFISKNDSGKMNYIFPVYGTGLWGPIWGYIAVGSDLNTIDGVVFDHKSETPGLGAEIATSNFENQFVGKQIFNGTSFVGVQVLKGAGASSGNIHAVDAVSGGTITSRAVQSMIIDCLKGYEPFILKIKGEQASAEQVVQ